MSSDIQKPRIRIMHRSMRTRSLQRGAVLAVSLILLAVLTVLALSASQSTRLQERMAGNTRNSDLAFQAAEAGLRNGEAVLASAPSNPPACSTLTSTCKVYLPGTLQLDLAAQTYTWWTSQPEYGALGSQEMAQVAEDPRYVVEEADFIYDDEGGKGDGEVSGRQLYRVTSAGVGGNTDAVSVVQSVFVRASN